MKFIIVIPARWGSTRFRGKPLAKINGKEENIQEKNIQKSAC